ncbi:MAG: shikimate dehydrogenase [Betaproteobacteria bacterium]|nr:shikimate dehydrogenase [Betaproteobacteria bacterium]
MTDLYAVFGNPVGHSLSPRIHTEFARLTGQDLRYEARLVPLDGFVPAVAAFRAEGGRGANVTVPFKPEAWRLSEHLSARAAAARAVNTLSFRHDGIHGDNTDGVGLVTDLRDNLGCAIRGRSVLLLGAGGAARGVILPLLVEQPALLAIANRTVTRAEELVVEFEAVARSNGYTGADTPISACGFDHLEGLAFDLVINATAASLADEAPPLPPGLFLPGAVAYDMVYGRGLTPFLAAARADGAARVADGLGMLVEQAAESFFVWRGVRPPTAPLLELLRSA